MRTIFVNSKATQRAILPLAGLTVMFAGTALAGGSSASANMSAEADVSNVCVISAAALNFGAYDPVVTNASADLVGSAALTITCTNGAAATITLDQGLHADSGSNDSSPLRRLSDGTDYLNYGLYSDSARSTIWQGPTGTGLSYTGTGSQTNNTIVYAKVPAGQNTIHAGTYTDTVVATITF